MINKKIVLFDMDKTLVLKNTAELWALYLDKKGMLADHEKKKLKQFHVDYENGTLDALLSLEFDLLILKKIPLCHHIPWRDDFFSTYVQQHISQKGMKLIQKYRQQEDVIIILITASLNFIAEPIAQYCQVHDLIASREERIEGDLTGKLIGDPNLGDKKIIHFNEWVKQNDIQVKHVTFYSDSINDFPLLNIVDKPIAVNPDKRLKEIAINNRWEIINF